MARRRQLREAEVEQDYIASLSQHAEAEEAQQSRYREAIRDYESKLAEYETNLKKWKEGCEALEKQWAFGEKLRLEKIAELEQQHHRRQNTKVEQLRTAWKNLRSSYFKSPLDAAVYFDLTFSLSPLPQFVPRQVQFAYLGESRQLVIERQLPLSSTIPDVAEYSFVKGTGELRPKPRSVKDIKLLYRKLVAALTLRTIHEAFLADVKKQIDLVAFNGFVETRDQATGREIKPCLVSVRVSREEFMAFDLEHVEEIACLQRLGAQLSPQPDECLPVKPVVDFNMYDKRFVEESDLLAEMGPKGTD